MKVRALKTVTRLGVNYAAGTIFDVPDEQAKSLIAEGLMEPAEEQSAKSKEQSAKRTREMSRPPSDRMVRGKNKKRSKV